MIDERFLTTLNKKVDKKMGSSTLSDLKYVPNSVAL